MLTDATIREYEERGFNAWPALHNVICGGWLLRFAQGHTRRANSVNALSASVALDGIVDFAETLYRQHEVPLVFRVTPLVRDLDAPLASDPAVSLSDHATADWLRGVDDAGGLSESARQVHRAMLAAQQVPAAFATLSEDGVPLAYGMAAYERGAVGLFEIQTLPHARRRGASRRLCGALLAWGQQRGARAAYLQVSANNHAALALYASLGFSLAYRYHYRART